MIFDASHALRFINETRAATGLPALTDLPFTGAVRVDERGCLLARALQAEIGGSADPGFSGHFVMRLGEQGLARAVARRTGQPCNDNAEVLLPEPLERLAVAFDRGQVEPRGARYVAFGQLSFDDLETSLGQAATDVGDSSAVTRPRESTDPRRPRTRGPGYPDRLRDRAGLSSTISVRTGAAGREHPGATGDGGSEAQAVPVPNPSGLTLARARLPHGGCRHRVNHFQAGVPARTLVSATRRAQAERSSLAPCSGRSVPRCRHCAVGSRRRHRAALSVVHHHTISAAHGAGPADSGPGRIGRRPGRPSLSTIARRSRCRPPACQVDALDGDHRQTPSEGNP